MCIVSDGRRVPEWMDRPFRFVAPKTVPCYAKSKSYWANPCPPRKTILFTATNPTIQVFPLQKTLAGDAIVERVDLLKAAVQRTALIIIDDEPEKSGLLDSLINLTRPDKLRAMTGVNTRVFKRLNSLGLMNRKVTRPIDFFQSLKN